MPEHSISLSHYTQFHDASILVKKSECMKSVFREAVGIELYSDMNREEGFCFRLWKLLIQTVKE
jgi:hypothetical protein